MTTKINRLNLSAAVLGLMLWVNSAWANDEAMNLLKRMQLAVHSLDYSGQVVYSQGDELSTFGITHSAAGGSEQESVILLDQGAGGAPGKAESFSLANFGNLHPTGQQSYTFDLGGDARVAGRPCKIVVVRPKDKLRFLHRYCIDADNGMLLKYSLMDRQQTLLEQLMFTQLTVNVPGQVVADNASSMAVLKAAAMPAAPDSTQATADSDSLVLDSWSFQSLPAGFRVVKVIPETGVDNAHQVVLSDGMTSVSLFIAPAALSRELDELSYSTGATHILGLEMAGHAITILGEVPPATLESIKNGLRYVGP